MLSKAKAERLKELRVKQLDLLTRNPASTDLLSIDDEIHELQKGVLRVDPKVINNRIERRLEKDKDGNFVNRDDEPAMVIGKKNASVLASIWEEHSELLLELSQLLEYDIMMTGNYSDTQILGMRGGLTAQIDFLRKCYEQNETNREAKKADTALDTAATA